MQSGLSPVQENQCSHSNISGGSPQNVKKYRLKMLLTGFVAE